MRNPKFWSNFAADSASIILKRSGYRKDGRQLDVSVTISPVKDPTGRIIGVSKVARDISSIKRVLREREELLERETAARAEAERVSRMKDEFLRHSLARTAYTAQCHSGLGNHSSL